MTDSTPVRERPRWAPPRSPVEIRLPTTLGRYRLEARLGRGGMGSVYRATLLGPAGFRKAVAIKLLRPERTGPRAEEAFLREARVGARLRHPHLMATHDLGVHGDVWFIVMDWIDGVSLRRFVGGEAMPGTALRRVGIDVARGLRHAHAAGLLHRDLKPSNIMLDRHGTVRIVDFGLAAALAASDPTRVAGTPGYMAPEQAFGEALDPRSDLYSLGLVLGELAVRRRLLSVPDDASYEAALFALDGARRDGRLRDEIDRRRPGLGELVCSLLALAPEERPASAEEVLLRLEGLPEGPAAHFFRAWAHRVVPPPAELPPEVAEVRCNLPADADGFVPRPRPARAVRYALEKARVVTLLGPGGAGKTRLAQRVAAELLPRHPGGVWFVDLSADRDAAAVSRSVGRALRLTLEGLDASADFARIGTGLAGWGPTLLVLDNAEQAVAAVGEAVRALADAAVEVRFVVTSRSPLGLVEERTVAVGPMDPGAAARLFTLRADAAGGRPGSPADIETLVAHLDHLPLAIELAAARTRLLDAGAILRRLDDRFRLLARPSVARHGSLRRCIAWSWELLDPAERIALACLAVFRGAWIDDAEAVLSALPELRDAWPVDLLTTLIDRSLVVAEVVDGTTRIRLLESIRAFATEQLAKAGAVEGFSGPDADRRVRDAHAAHYVGFGTAAERRRLRVHGGMPLRAHRVHDLGNLGAAVDHALGVGDIGTAVLGAVAALDVQFIHGPMGFGLALAERVLRMPMESVDGRDHRSLRIRLGATLHRLGRNDEAIELLEGALAEMTDPAERSGPDVVLGGVYVDVGRYEEGVALCRAAVERGDDSVDARPVLALSTIAVARSHQHDLEGLPELFEEAARRSLERGHMVSRIAALGNGAITLRRMGRVAESEEPTRQAIALARRLGSRMQEAATRSSLAETLWELGRTAESIAEYERAYEVARFGGYPRVMAAVDAGLARATWPEDPVGARRRLEGAIRRGRAMKFAAVPHWEAFLAQKDAEADQA